MDFVSIVLFMSMYYLRPQEWIGSLSKLHPVQLVMALAIFASFNRERGFKFNRIFRTPHDWLMAAYFAWIIFTHPSPWYAFKEIQNVMLFYVIIVQTLTDIPRINRFFSWWAVMIMVIVVLALLGNYSIFDPFHSHDRTEGIMKGRLQLNLSIFDNANALGHSVVPVIPMLYFLLFWKRIFMKAGILLLALPLWVIFLTQSKGSFLCGFVTVLATLTFGRPKVVQIVILTLAICFGYAALYSLPRMTTLKKARSDPGIQGRIAAWTFGLQTLRTHTTGLGYRMWWDNFNRYGPLREKEEHRKPGKPARMEHYGIATHGTYNQNGAELGFTGLFLFIGILYACLRTVTTAKTANVEEERARRILAVIIITYAVSSWMVDFGFRTTFFMFAAAASAYHRILMRTQDDENEEEWSPVPVGTQPVLASGSAPVPSAAMPVWMMPLQPAPVPATAAVGDSGTGSPEPEHDDQETGPPPVMAWKRVGILDLVLIYALTRGAVKYWAYIIGNL
jgi:uncharacterized membrane protein YwzB